MTPTITLIIPTVSRPTLHRALCGFHVQHLPGDQLIVVGDGPQLEARKLFDACGLPGLYLETQSKMADWGHGPRNFAMPFATGDLLLSIDDDDALLPSALGDIRMAAAECPYRPLLFRMLHPDLPVNRRVECGNFSTQMIVVPNRPSRLGRWGNHYAGDTDFLISTLKFYPPDALVWRDETTVYHNA